MVTYFSPKEQIAVRFRNDSHKARNCDKYLYNKGYNMLLRCNIKEAAHRQLAARYYKMVHSQDSYTARHGLQVGGVSVEVAVGMQLQLTQSELVGLCVAGSLHDIGKILMPRDLLRKRIPISQEEYEYLQHHVLSGYEMVVGEDWPWPVPRVVLEHHERLDGSGYPAGLTGDQMHPMSKIVAVVDVVDAIATQRPYRDGLGIQRALDEIQQHKGIKYDIDVVNAVQMLVDTNQLSIK